METPLADLGNASAAHRDNIRRIYGLGMTEGTSPTTFSPDACTTRQQMASFLARAYPVATTALRSSPSPYAARPGATE